MITDMLIGTDMLGVGCKGGADKSTLREFLRVLIELYFFFSSDLATQHFCHLL